jgi:hypothetical protein
LGDESDATSEWMLLPDVLAIEDSTDVEKMDECWLGFCVGVGSLFACFGMATGGSGAVKDVLDVSARVS